MERKNRHPRPALSGSRHRHLGIFLENQRRGILEKTSRPGNVSVARSAPVSRQPGQGQNRAHHRTYLLYIFAFHKGRTADQAPARHERRHLYQLRQQRFIRRQEHPNATKVFINWLLGKEGQEIDGKTMGQATRSFDVETKWMVEHGVRASKDFLTVEENNRLENYGEDTVNNYWAKSTKIAEEVFK